MGIFLKPLLMASIHSFVSLLANAGRPAAQHTRFLLLWLLSVIALQVPLSAVVNIAISDERYSHIVLVPLLSGCVIWLGRKRIFRESRYCLRVGIPLFLAGMLLLGVMSFWPLILGPNVTLSVTVGGIILVWTALFVLCYGVQALQSATFPFLFLLLMIPIPASLMDKAVLGLQKGSADVSHGLFKLIGVPVLRDGFKFSLPGVAIEVAAECSGIRSGLSLLISSLLAGHLVLRSHWGQLWFALFTIPVVIFKNAVRIVTISWLGVYVDRSYLFGDLHRHGGLPFSLLAIAILALALRVMQKAESHPKGKSPGFGGQMNTSTSPAQDLAPSPASRFDSSGVSE